MCSKSNLESVNIKKLQNLEKSGPVLQVQKFVRKKIKQSHYSPEQALSVPGGSGSHISRQSAHEGGMVVSPTHRPPLPPQEIFPVLVSVRG